LDRGLTIIYLGKQKIEIAMGKILNESNINEVTASNSFTGMIKFGATWCSPCRTMNVVVEELDQETTVDIYTVDVDESPELSANFKIRNIPYFVFIKDGEVKGTAVGVVSKAVLAEKLSELAPQH
jgi:thioredoxin 1